MNHIHALSYERKLILVLLRAHEAQLRSWRASSAEIHLVLSAPDLLMQAASFLTVITGILVAAGVGHGEAVHCERSRFLHLAPVLHCQALFEIDEGVHCYPLRFVLELSYLLSTIAGKLWCFFYARHQRRLGSTVSLQA